MLKKRVKIILIILTVIPLLSGCNRWEKNGRDFDQRAIVRILSSNSGFLSEGSGFVTEYRNRTLVITAAHVSNRSMHIYFLNSRRHLLKVSVIDVVSPGNNDISAILVKGLPKNFPRLKIDTKTKPLPTLRVQCCGYAPGEKLTITNGQIVGYTGIQSSGRLETYLVTDCYCVQGMSGGPLLHKGRVIAINSASNLKKDRPLTIHVPIRIVIDLLSHISN